MEALLLAYANAASDVGNHVAFGVVAPPALAHFFSAVVYRVRLESLGFRSPVFHSSAGKVAHFRIYGVASQLALHRGQVRQTAEIKIHHTLQSASLT